MKLPQFSKRLNKPDNHRRQPLLIRAVVGSSMVPGLKPGAIVLGWRYYRSLKIGQIVVLNHQGLETIKRITELDSDAQKIYVQGDNRRLSTDSRDYGWLPLADVKAVVVWPRNRVNTDI